MPLTMAGIGETKTQSNSIRGNEGDNKFYWQILDFVAGAKLLYCRRSEGNVIVNVKDFQSGGK